MRHKKRTIILLSVLAMVFILFSCSNSYYNSSEGDDLPALNGGRENTRSSIGVEDGHVYYIEADKGNYTDVPRRYVSYTSDSKVIDLWHGKGINQRFRVIKSGDYYYFRNSYGLYLSHTGVPSSGKVFFSPDRGEHQKFTIIRSYEGDTYYIKAVSADKNVDSKSRRYLSFSGKANNYIVDLWHGAGTNQQFIFHPAYKSGEVFKPLTKNMSCPDPFIWIPKKYPGKFRLTGTVRSKEGANFTMFESNTINGLFDRIGDLRPSNEYDSNKNDGWPSNTNNWAPEIYDIDETYSLIFFSTKTSGKHRIGASLSTNGGDTYKKLSYTYLDLKETSRGNGVIDPHVFEDRDGKTYILWKVNDNYRSSLYIQEIKIYPQGDSPNDVRKFLSYPSNSSTVDLWHGRGINQRFTLIKTGDYYYLKNSYGKYLSHNAEPNSGLVDFWPHAGINQRFEIFESPTIVDVFYIRAVSPEKNIDDKSRKYLSFSGDPGNPIVDLWHSAGPNQQFYFQGASSRKYYDTGLIDGGTYYIKANKYFQPIELVGEPVLILGGYDQIGGERWWETSFNNNGKLLEGPELIYTNGYYYLFYTAGRYNDASYSQNVARSRNIFGPYVKMKSPVLNTTMVGTSSYGEKLTGPGHGSLIYSDNKWTLVFHAITYTNEKGGVKRVPFLVDLDFSTGWPRVK